MNCMKGIMSEPLIEQSDFELTSSTSPPTYKHVNTHLCWSIMNTFCFLCCFPFVLPFSIPALIFSLKSRESRRAGNLTKAMAHSRIACKFNGIILGFFMLLVLFVLLLVIFCGGLLSSIYNTAGMIYHGPSHDVNM